MPHTPLIVVNEGSSGGVWDPGNGDGHGTKNHHMGAKGIYFPFWKKESENQEPLLFFGH